MKLPRTAQTVLLAMIATSGFLSATGCGSSATTRPSEYDRQDKALRDPFGYSPNMKRADDTVTGNSEFDKDAFKRDLDHVINP